MLVLDDDRVQAVVVSDAQGGDVHLQLPLHLDELNGSVTADDLQQALLNHYAPSKAWGGMVSVEPPTANAKLDALALNDTNKLEIRVYGNPTHRQALLVARLDNLGKGASGAAVQNLQLHGLIIHHQQAWLAGWRSQGQQQI